MKEMSEIEKNIIEVTGFKPSRIYKNRQDYLAALLLAITDLDEEELGALNDDAFDWANLAAGARKHKEVIPEFQDYVEPVEEPDTSDIPEATEEFFEKAEVKQPKKKYNIPAARAARIPKGQVPTHKLTGNFDQWGFAEGTKHSQVAAMFARPEGASMREIKDAFHGQTYYELLKIFTKNGHKVEKDPDTLKYRVIHKDEA
jgi:hypothetical protein